LISSPETIDLHLKKVAYLVKKVGTLKQLNPFSFSSFTKRGSMQVQGLTFYT